MTDTPKTWGEMSDAEKGALLLAHHEKPGSVEFHNGEFGWEAIEAPGWFYGAAYRIKPEPKREKRRLHCSPKYANAYQSPYAQNGTSHVITYDIIDGEPDCTSVKMERIK